MTSDQQFWLQMIGILLGALITVLGMMFTYLKASQAVIQSTAARDVAAAGVEISMNNGKKSDHANEKLVEIHTLTNSNLSDAVKRLDVAMEKISGLEKMVSNMTADKVTADRTAENLAGKVASAPGARQSRASDTVPHIQEVKIVETVDPVPVIIEDKLKRK